MVTLNDLVNIFYSGGNERRADRVVLMDIRYLLESGMLLCAKKLVCSKKIYYRYIEDLRLGKIAQYGVDGGTVGHMALKLIALDMLKNIDYGVLLIEQEYSGYRPDVMTKNGEIIIECGTVNPDKVFAYFKLPTTEQLVILPYPTDEEEDVAQYIFTPGDELREFILFLEKERLDKIKNIIDRRIG